MDGVLIWTVYRPENPGGDAIARVWSIAGSSEIQATRIVLVDPLEKIRGQFTLPIMPRLGRPRQHHQTTQNRPLLELRTVQPRPRPAPVPDGPPQVKELDFSEFHPLGDHRPGDHRCRTLPGGWRNHLSLAWEYRWLPALSASTWCRVGCHEWRRGWKYRTPIVLCRNCWRSSTQGGHQKCRRPPTG
jgi:hypothetical protein